MIYDILIIGGGPAGLTSAIYGLRANKKVLIIEQEQFGGQITRAKSVENYPGFKEISGTKLANLMYEQAKELNMEEVMATVNNVTKNDEIFTVSTTKGDYLSKTVIVATGSKPQKLGVEGEKELTGLGVSYCATCDGSLYKDKTVAVVGGGNTAITDALYLASICKKVYLIHRREKFVAEAKNLKKLKNLDNVTFMTNKVVEKIIGKQKLEKIKIKDVITEEKETLELDGLFLAIGRTPNIELIKEYMKKGNMECEIKGLYFAGDVREKPVYQLTTAESDGTISAILAIRYLNDMNKKD